MTHGIEKQAVEQQLQDCIIAAIRGRIACSRISGFVRVERSEDTVFDVPLAFVEAPLDSSGLSRVSLGILDFSSAPSSPSGSSTAPKVSRRKAYLPKKIPEPSQMDSEPPIAALDPRALQASVSEAMAPSMAVFPTATPEYASPPLPPPPPLAPSDAVTRSLAPPKKSRAIRPKAPGGGGAARQNGGVKRSPTKEFSCNQCREKFRSLNSLTEHTTAVHQCFRCTTCNAKFTQRSNLQRHSLKHLGFKPFKCAICRKEYYRKDHLVRHVEVSHPGSDPKSSIVNVLPSSECLRLAEVERKLQEAAVDLSLTRQENSAPSSEVEESGSRGEEELEEMEEEEVGEVEEEPTDLSLGGQVAAPFLLPMRSLAR